MRMRHLSIAVALVLAASGCGSGTAQPPGAPAISVVTPYLANAATKDVVDKFTAIGERRGWQVTVTDTAGDFSMLNDKIQSAASRRPSAIVLAMGDPTQLTLGLKAAGDNKVPVFAIDAAQADGIAANVTSDNADLGRKSAAALLEAIGGSGNVAMFGHDPHPGVRARAAAARAEFDKAGVTVVTVKHVPVPGPVEGARKLTTDLLAVTPDLKGIWAAWDEPALGATQAIRQAGRMGIAVVGVDGQDFALAEIQKAGPFYATVKQDWDAVALKVADLITDQLAGKAPTQREYALPGTTIARTT
ncbi:sugar ABC transporter substrate-binding protein [Herbidospora galbida]|uniref:Sugar ABC transporter substrate-binding protein n=1 Tax=Herbidospora galbida TaxID=2575442 RepID=A0A4U3MQN6_9ACTN|nr:substrate-binding domain-containing protein [Herbidospora galbida]TKK91460.1 sugar ABC transporter substrate-binding protein [Herbidospora galbida]